MEKKKGGGGGGGNTGNGGQTGGKPAKEEAGKAKNGGDETKKGGGGGSITVVLKVDMHCNGCAKNVVKSVRGIEGIEKVTADKESNKLTVIGKVDPIRIRDRVQAKTHKHVELISPNPKKNDKKEEAEKKPKEPQLSTVVLKIRLHCDGCNERIRKAITKIKGVASVSMDTDKDLVTVRGIMEVKTLPEILAAKLKRPVEIVPPKKEKKDGEKEDDKGKDKDKDKGKGKGDEKGGKGGGEKKKGEDQEKKEYYYGQYGNSPYDLQMVYAPQFFSDENPNACSVM